MSALTDSKTKPHLSHARIPQVTRGQKAAWVRAAAPGKLDEWIVRTLDMAAKKELDARSPVG